VATVTSVIELLVGLACLGLGAVVWPRNRFIAVALGVAGLAAVIHAVVDLV
jgi:uncharacterized membrane protein YhfC